MQGLHTINQHSSTPRPKQDQDPDTPNPPCCLTTVARHLLGSCLETQPIAPPPPPLRQLYAPALLHQDKIKDYLNLRFFFDFDINKIATIPSQYYVKVDFIYELEQIVEKIGECHYEIIKKVDFIYELEQIVEKIGECHYEIIKHARRNQEFVRHNYEPTNYDEIKSNLIDHLTNLKEDFHQRMNKLSQMNLNEEKVFNAKKYFYSLYDLYNVILGTEEITTESNVKGLGTWEMSDSEWSILDNTLFTICELLIKQLNPQDPYLVISNPDIKAKTRATNLLNFYKKKITAHLNSHTHYYEDNFISRLVEIVKTIETVHEELNSEPIYLADSTNREIILNDKKTELHANLEELKLQFSADMKTLCLWICLRELNQKKISDLDYFNNLECLYHTILNTEETISDCNDEWKIADSEWYSLYVSIDSLDLKPYYTNKLPSSGSS